MTCIYVYIYIESLVTRKRRMFTQCKIHVSIVLAPTIQSSRAINGEERKKESGQVTCRTQSSNFQSSNNHLIFTYGLMQA